MERGARAWRRRIAAVLLTAAFIAGPGAQDPVAVAEPISPPPAVQVSTRATLAVGSWQAGSGATYAVDVDTRPDFTTATRTGVAGAVVVLESLDPETTYYLRVSAVSADGTAGAPSPTTTFTTGPAPFELAAPVLTLESLSSTSVVPSWSGPVEDARYEVELAEDDTFSKAERRLVGKQDATFVDLATDVTFYARVRVVSEAGTPLSAWSATASKKTKASRPLTVGSYNVLKAASKKGWVQRRGAVASTILGENPDVVGLQEATPVTVPGGYRQYADVARLLGPEWALTTSAGEVRIVYNKTRLTLIRDGYDLLEGSRTLGVQRYAPWAVFEQKSTSKRFFFMNTHFLPQNGAKADRLRASASRQMVATIERTNTDRLPVVIVGDFNSGGMRNSANAVYRTFTSAGYIDPLARSRKLGAAEDLVRTELKTVNKLKRTAARDSTPPMIDQIFVSRMRVASYEVVAKLNRSGRFVGTIPSDHNMIRATVYLP